MNTYKIYADIHKGHPHASDIELTYEPNCVFLGDIWDIKNTRQDDIPKALEAQKEHNSIVLANNLVSVKGNHDLEDVPPYPDSDYYKAVNGVLFTHGHLTAWTQEEIDKWRNKPRTGSSIFKWSVVSSYSWFSRGRWNPSNEERNLLIEKAKAFDCHTICIGHHHPSETFDTKDENSGIRIVCVKRGETIIDL
jgi:metallophosphoesterase superfamily enzyme